LTQVFDIFVELSEAVTVAMADASNNDSSDSEFGQFIDDLVENRAQISDQSDLSISSVHTSDLSDISDRSLSPPSSSEDDDVDSEAEWSDTIVDHNKEAFTQVPGPTLPLGLDAKPIDYFLQLFPEENFERMREESERYARQKGDLTFVTSAAEMKSYLGLLFYMGIVQLPNYRCYWSEHPGLRQSFVANTMSRHRYELLTKYIHLEDSTTNPPRGSPNHDKLHKVRSILEMAKLRFSAAYYPHQNISVDEAMIKFTGRCAILQYIPAKPCKWGIKAWAVADSENFYLLNFNIYCGKEAANVDNAPLGTRVVTKLVEPYYKRHHHVYFDNYFTSVQLLEILLRKKTYACGTVRKSRRGLPVGIKTLKFKQSGEMRKWQKGKLTAVAWCEKKRQINVLSTGNSCGNMERRRPGRRGQPEQRYPKPICVQEYTDNYNGVDKNDQLRSYYGIAARANKWWKYLFWFICDTSLVNAYILHCEAPGGPRPRPLSHLDFNLSVAETLIAAHKSRKRSSSTKPPDGAHVKVPAVHVPTRITTARRQKNCVLCSKENRRTPAGHKIQSAFECCKCGVGLCKDRGCFAQFHNFEN
jgi:hypothetical protein